MDTPVGHTLPAEAVADVRNDEIDLDPDDPLLARAQEALKRQLAETQQRVQEELREKTKLLNDAKQRKEDLGVNLFNFQQQLATLQMELEKSHETHSKVAAQKDTVAQRVQEVNTQHDEEMNIHQSERLRTDKLQEELDRQAATLHQIEAYHTSMKQEIAVTRRATYKAEESIQNLEKEKGQQDSLIDKLQETLKSLHQQAALVTAQLDAQKGEMRSAMETLVEAEKEMEAVHFEKRQLLSQWNSSLRAISARETSLAAVKAAIHEQQEQDLSISNEIHRFRKDTLEQQVRHETLSGTVEKLECEIQAVKKSMDTVKDKAERMQEMLSKLERAQSSMDERLQQCNMAKTALTAEIASTDKTFTRSNAENMGAEEKMIAVLGEQMTVQKGSAGAATHIQKKQKAVHDKELKVVMIQNEVAKLTVDVLNTEAHNVQLGDTLKLLDDELVDKAKVIDKYQLEIQRRNDDVEKKTRNVDTLNRKLEKLLYDMEGEDTGPLEATINNLNRELQRKDVESKDLQRHWINLQTELVAKQNENSALTEQQARLSSQFSILFQKKGGLQRSLETEQQEVHKLERQMNHANQDMARLNSLISSNQNTAASLEDKYFHLQQSVMSELKDQEAEAKKLENDVDQCSAKKKELLSEVLETEREIMLWERKLQLDREMRELLDPTIGQDVIGAMEKEIHRMELRMSDLEKVKEQLMKELERSVEKRDTIASKGRASVTNANKVGGKLTEKQLTQKSKELQQSIGDTEAECEATDKRNERLDNQRVGMAERMHSISQQSSELRAEDDQARNQLHELFQSKTEKSLRAESLAQAATMLQSSKFKHDHGILGEEDRIRSEQQKVLDLMHSLSSRNPDFALEAETIKLHLRAVEAV